jgi:HPr kinase/phosphorylase
MSARGVTVRALLASQDAGLHLDLLAGGEGLERMITVPRVQKPGLALTGYLVPVHPERIQVLGYAEVSFLGTLDSTRVRAAVEGLCALEPSCLAVTRGMDVPDALREVCDRHRVPLLRTPLMSSVFIGRVVKFLEAQLSPGTTLHGVLVDVFGVGILLIGKSGIGKSEAALDLVLRGHRLVADDIVELRLGAPDAVIGSGSEVIKHHMEIRGLGIINIKDLFGVAAVRDAKKVELAVELVEWDEEEEYDRIGLDELRYPILGVEIPMLRIPVRPGRNITTIIEVAGRNQLLKLRGHHSARDFQDQITRAIAESRLGGVPPGEVE